MCAAIQSLLLESGSRPSDGMAASVTASLWNCSLPLLKPSAARGITYLHLIEGRASEIGLDEHLNENALNNAQLFRSRFDGPLITAGAFTPQTGAMAVEQRHSDAVAFGRMFIANPDLVARIRRGLPLNAYDRSTFYGGGEHGYTDYPVFDSFPQERSMAV